MVKGLGVLERPRLDLRSILPFWSLPASILALWSLPASIRAFWRLPGSIWAFWSLPASIWVLEHPRLDLGVLEAPTDCYGQFRVVPKCGSATKTQAQIRGVWVAKLPTATGST